MTVDVDSVGVASAAGLVRWGQQPHAFELRSSDALVLERAAVVFRPWTSVQPAPILTGSWTVAPHGDSPDQWTLRTDGAADEPIRADPTRAVTVVEFLAVQAVLEGPPDVFTVHAALVAREGRGVLIFGPGESGKSTLACALWRSGFSLLGDDVTLVDPETAEARPAPRRVSLRASSRLLLGDDLWARILAAPATEPTAQGCVFHPDEIDGSRPSAVRIAACVFLARLGAGRVPGLVRPLPAAQAVLALLPYSNLIRRFDAGTLIGRVATFAAGLSHYDLGRAPLAEMVTTVERLLDRAA